MAMLISKFNRLIASRFVWIMFALVICLAMVFFIPNVDPFAALPGGQGASKGVIAGQEVSNEQFFENQAKISFMNRIFRQRFREPDAQKRSTYERIALLDQAKQMGVTISDDEANEYLKTKWLDGFVNDPRAQRETPLSWDDGYQFLLRSAGAEGLSRVGMLSAVKDHLSALGVQETLGDTILTPEYDLKRYYSREFDSVELEYLPQTNSVDRATIEVTDEAVRTFYDDNEEEFRVPEKRKVSVAKFQIEDFVDPTLPKDEEVEFRYQGQYTDYLTVIERPNPAAALDPSFPKTVVTHDVQALADVEEELRLEIARDDYAPQQAAKHALDLISDLTEEYINFEEEVARYTNATSFTTGYLVNTSEVENVEDDSQRAVLATAFDLADGRYKRVCREAIVGSNEVYVLYHQETQESFIPEFDAVLDDVREKTIDDAHETAFAGVLTNRIEAIASSTNSLAALFTNEADQVQTLNPFSISQIRDLERQIGGQVVMVFSNQLLFAEEAYDVEAGEYLDPVFREGVGYIARVKSRTASASPTANLGSGDFRNEFSQRFEGAQVGAIYSSWTSNLLSQVTIEEETLEEDAEDAADGASE